MEISRYLRLYGHFVAFSFSRAMEFRVDFFFRILMDIMYYIVQLSFFLIIYEHTSLLGGWNRDQIIVFTATYLLIDALYMTFFSNNTWWLPIFVNKGDLDYYLVRPVSSLFFLSLREFAANSFLNLLMAIGIVIWALGRYPEPLGALAITGYLLAVVLGSVIYYCLNMFFIIPCFWLHSVQGLREVHYQINKYMERPHRIFTGWLQRLLLSAIPLAMVASYPTMLLLEGWTILGALHMLAVTVLGLLAVILFWERALRAYSSASS